MKSRDLLFSDSRVPCSIGCQTMRSFAPTTHMFDDLDVTRRALIDDFSRAAHPPLEAIKQKSGLPDPGFQMCYPINTFAKTVPSPLRILTSPVCSLFYNTGPVSRDFYPFPAPRLSGTLQRRLETDSYDLIPERPFYALIPLPPEIGFSSLNFPSPGRYWTAPRQVDSYGVLFDDRKSLYGSYREHSTLLKLRRFPARFP